MAIAITSPATGLFDPDTRDKAGLARRLTLAVLGAGSAAQRATARAELCKAADFKVSFTSSNADALANCLKLSGSSSRGVTFPAQTLRTIRMVMRSRNDADQFYQVIEQDVYGNDGTTPVLGNARLVKACMVDAAVYKAMGDIEINSVVDVEGAESAPGSALAAYSSGYALTFPPSRVAIVKGVHVSQDAYELATSPGHATIEALSATAGTGNVESYVTGAGTATAVAAADLLQISMKLWPPMQVALVLNSTAVEVHARSVINDVFTHNLEVFVGQAESVFFGA
jgi:hypothetical protein